MPVSKYAKRLSAMKKNFARAKNEAGTMFGSLDIDPGTYNAQLSSIKFQENKKKGSLLCISEFLLIDGEYEGAKVPVFHYPENEAAQPFFVRYVEVLTGYEFPDDPADLEAAFEEVTEEAPECVIEIERNKGTGQNEGKVFTNVNLIERISEVSDGSEGEEVEPEEAPAEEEEAPEEEQVEESAEEESPDDPELLASAIEFCEVNEVPFEADDTCEILAERISADQYSGASMGDEELALFKALDIMDCVEMPKKKAPKIKKTVKKKEASPPPPPAKKKKVLARKKK